MATYEHDDFPYEPHNRTYDLRNAWDIAIGLQETDGLQPSPYLRSLAEDTVSGTMTLDAAGIALRTYYQERESAAAPTGNREKEADLVSHRITELLMHRAFALTPSALFYIHRFLFQDFDDAFYAPGRIKTEQLVKKEAILNGDSVLYGAPEFANNALAMFFEREMTHAYGFDMTGDDLENFCAFIAHIWQVHPFEEGNTRTIAVFGALYLDYLGFDIDNDPFTEHARYFRNALVRANYRNAKAKIAPTLRYLVRFFENTLHDAKHRLESKDLACLELFEHPELLRNIPPAEALSLQR
ncbi:MAG: Fic family protein [Slackia sp.]|nr:Fic family protein [Slackia sp.]